MKRNCIRTFILITLIITLPAFCCPASAADSQAELFTADGFVYQLNDAQEAVIVSYTGNEKKLEIPAFLEGHPVVCLASKCLMQSNLTEVIIPSSVRELKDRVFSNCYSLTKATFANGVTKMGEHVFFACSKLQEVTFPDTLTEIGNAPLAHCPSLKSILIDDGHPYLELVDNVLYSIPDHKLIWYPETRKDKEYIVVDGTKIIGEYAFAGCKAKNIVLPDSVERIDAYAFCYCKNLTSFRIPPKLTSYDRIITDCNKLTELSVAEDNTCFEVRDGALYQTQTHSLVYFPASVRIKEYVVPEDVEEIQGGCFSGAGIHRLVFTGPVKHIGVDAFIDCKNLKEVIFPEGLEYLNSFSFAYCNKLKYVKLPSTLKKLTANPFMESQLLESFDTAGNNADVAIIDNCLVTLEDMRIIAYPGGAKEKDVVIPDGIKVINREAFYNQANMTTLMIPEGVESIRYRAFLGCRKLKRVILPESLKQIDRTAFCSDNSFTNYLNAVFAVKRGSYAESFCLSYGLKVEYTDEI